MKKLILLIVTFVLLPFTFAFAQQATVKKVKGSQAIVEFPQGSRPYVGQALNVGDGQSGSGADGAGSRARTIMLSGEFVSTDGSTTLSALAAYGWNLTNLEFGPLFRYDSSKVANFSSSTLSLGGFFDYNLIPNQPGAALVYGAAAEGNFSMVSSGDSSGSGIGIFAGGFLKWFVLNNSTAIRANMGFAMNNDGTTTASGIKTSAALQVYF